MSIHVEPINIQVAIIEGEIGAGTVERLAGSNYCRSAGKRSAAEALHRASVKVEGTQVEISMVARPRWSGSLYLVAALRVLLQVESVGNPCVHIFEVGVRSESDSAVVATGGG